MSTWASSCFSWPMAPVWKGNSTQACQAQSIVCCWLVGNTVLSARIHENARHGACTTALERTAHHPIMLLDTANSPAPGVVLAALQPS